MSEMGTDGGSWLATMMLVPLWRISRTTSMRPATRSGLSMYLWASSKTTSLLNECRPLLVVLVGEELEQHDEEAEGFVLLDELVAEVDDDEAARADLVLQANRVVDVLARELEAHLRQPLRWSGKRRGLDALVQPLEREVVAQRLHHAVELSNVRALVADRAHEEAPVARLQLGGAELQRAHLDARVLLLRSSSLSAGARSSTSESARLRAVASPSALHLRHLAVRRDHRRELRPVVHRRAVVEDDRRERLREDVDVRDGQDAISAIVPSV